MHKLISNSEAFLRCPKLEQDFLNLCYIPIHGVDKNDLKSVRALVSAIVRKFRYFNCQGLLNDADFRRAFLHRFLDEAELTHFPTEGTIFDELSIPEIQRKADIHLQASVQAQKWRLGHLKKLSRK